MLSLSACLTVLETEEERETFTAFYERYRHLVFYRAKQLVQNETEAEDVAQEVFLYAADHFDKFRGRHHRESAKYLLLCTASRAADALERARRQAALEAEAAAEQRERETEWDSAERIVLRRDTAARMLEAVNALPERYCAALSLRLDGASYAEIAQALGVSEETARKRAVRGYGMLRQRMRGDGDEA